MKIWVAAKLFFLSVASLIPKQALADVAVSVLNRGGSAVYTADGHFGLILGQDGILAEYDNSVKPSKEIWNSRTDANALAVSAPAVPGVGTTAYIQNDGNFVLYDQQHGNVATWASKTAGNPGAAFVLQSGDGNLVLYAPSYALSGGTPLWSAQSGQITPYQIVSSVLVAYVGSTATPLTTLCLTGSLLVNPFNLYIATTYNDEAVAFSFATSPTASSEDLITSASSGPGSGRFLAIADALSGQNSGTFSVKLPTPLIVSAYPLGDLSVPPLTLPAVFPNPSSYRLNVGHCSE